MTIFESLKFGIVMGVIGAILLVVFVFAFIFYEAGNQKRRRAKNRVIADMVISGQRDAGIREINGLIDELLRLNNRFVGESEEDRIRVEQLRRIRDERSKDA